jgi:hypothetical protein
MLLSGCFLLPKEKKDKASQRCQKQSEPVGDKNRNLRIGATKV